MKDVGTLYRAGEETSEKLFFMFKKNNFREKKSEIFPMITNLYICFSISNGYWRTFFKSHACTKPCSFDAPVQAVEEAIINAMVVAETMEGINGNKAYALPHKLVLDLLKKYNRAK